MKHLFLSKSCSEKQIMITKFMIMLSILQISWRLLLRNVIIVNGTTDKCRAFFEESSSLNTTQLVMSVFVRATCFQKSVGKLYFMLSYWDFTDSPTESQLMIAMKCTSVNEEINFKFMPRKSLSC